MKRTNNKFGNSKQYRNDGNSRSSNANLISVCNNDTNSLYLKGFSLLKSCRGLK